MLVEVQLVVLSGWLRGVWGRSGCCGENVENPFEIAGDGGEVNLGGGNGHQCWNNLDFPPSAGRCSHGQQH